MFKTADFAKIYLNLYCEEHIHLSNLSITDFYQNLTQFKQNKIVNESASLFDIPQPLVLSLLEQELFEQEISNIFFSYFKQSKHFKNIAANRLKEIKIFFFQFSFQNETEIQLFNTEIFGELTDSQKQIAKQTFIEKNSAADGFTYYNKNLDKNIFIIALNTKSTNQYQTVIHELSHLIQQIIGIKISQSINLTNKQFDKTYLKKFNINFDLFKNYLTPLEFLPYIQDLISGLEKVHKMYYSDLKKQKFLLKVFACLNTENPMQLELMKQYITLNNDAIPLIILFCSFHYSYKFQKIKHILLQHFPV